jgi:hypothetical protein
MTVSEWINLGTLIVAVLGVVLVLRQIKKLSEQLLLQHFAEYTKRYQEIILHLPEDVNVASFVLDGRDDYDRTMRYMRAYMDLCWEEWHLHNRRLIDSETWGVWKCGMEAAFSKPAFQQAWKKIEADSAFGSDFGRFVAALIRRDAHHGRGA